MYNNNDNWYSPSPNNAGGYGTGSYGPAQRRKRSGASQKTISKGKYQGKPCVTGWNFRKGQGLISVFCGPYKKTKRGKSKAGKRYETWIAKLYNKTTHQQQILPCMFYPDEGKVVIDQMEWVVNPRTNYCGTYVRRKGR